MEVSFPDECACRALLAQYRSILSELKRLLKRPKRLLREIKDMLDYPFNRASQILNEYLNALPNLLKPNLGIQELLRSLERILDCPILADSALGQMAAAAIDAIQAGLKDITGIVNQLKNAASQGAGDVLQKFKSMGDNTIGALQKKYDALLDSLGITALLRMLGQLEQCFANLCQAWAAAHNTANKVIAYLPDDSTSIWEALGKKYDAVHDKIVDIPNQAQARAAAESEAFAKRYRRLEQSCKTIVGV